VLYCNIFADGSITNHNAIWTERRKFLASRMYGLTFALVENVLGYGVHQPTLARHEGFPLEILKDNRFAFVGVTMAGTGSRCPLSTTRWGLPFIDGATAGGQLSYEPSSTQFNKRTTNEIVLRW